MLPSQALLCPGTGATAPAHFQDAAIFATCICWCCRGLFKPAKALLTWTLGQALGFGFFSGLFFSVLQDRCSQESGVSLHAGLACCIECESQMILLLVYRALSCIAHIGFWLVEVITGLTGLCGLTAGAVFSSQSALQSPNWPINAVTTSSI